MKNHFREIAPKVLNQDNFDILLLNGPVSVIFNFKRAIKTLVGFGLTLGPIPDEYVVISSPQVIEYLYHWLETHSKNKRMYRICPVFQTLPIYNFFTKFRF